GTPPPRCRRPSPPAFGSGRGRTAADWPTRPGAVARAASDWAPPPPPSAVPKTTAAGFAIRRRFLKPRLTSSSGPHLLRLATETPEAVDITRGMRRATRRVIVAL